MQRGKVPSRANGSINVLAADDPQRVSGEALTERGRERPGYAPPARHVRYEAERRGVSVSRRDRRERPATSARTSPGGLTGFIRRYLVGSSPTRAIAKEEREMRNDGQHGGRCRTKIPNSALPIQHSGSHSADPTPRGPGHLSRTPALVRPSEPAVAKPVRCASGARADLPTGGMRAVARSLIEYLSALKTRRARADAAFSPPRGGGPRPAPRLGEVHPPLVVIRPEGLDADQYAGVECASGDAISPWLAALFVFVAVLLVGGLP
jgi:hypothetical protein